MAVADMMEKQLKTMVGIHFVLLPKAITSPVSALFCHISKTVAFIYSLFTGKTEN